MKEKRRKKNKKIAHNKKSIKKDVIKLLLEQSPQAFNQKQIAFRLGIKYKKDKSKLSLALLELCQTSKILEESIGRYKIKEKKRFLEGIIELSKQDFAFVIVEGMEEDIFIPAGKQKRAFNGDKVRVLVERNTRRKKGMEGKVVKILEPNNSGIIGILQVSENFAFLIPQFGKNNDVFIPKNKLKGAKDGQKVAVKLIESDKKGISLVGKVIQIFGNPGEHNTEIKLIMTEFHLPLDFTETQKRDVDKISEIIRKDEIAKRKDFRDITTFTVDPKNAKDFDDALSIRELSNNNWEVGVHIADVSHFLKPNTGLDKEAQKRANSVYLVDRVIPMLPEKISNKLCSLRPNEEKLCFSAVFEMNKQAKIINEWFGKTIIKSNKRFNYEQAQDLIETKEGEFSKEINILNNLASKLRDDKFALGAISFEKDEIEFELDENFKPISIIPKKRTQAHMLIEDFMLLANRRVAEFISRRRQTFIYRVHDLPNEEKLEVFAALARKFGYNFSTLSPNKLPYYYNNLMQEIKGKPEQNMFETLAVRTMAKAKYTTNNIGHYGLGFESYTHFTSPIRRYPDVMVHRLLEKYLKNSRNPSKQMDFSEEKIEELCKHASEKEINATKAERASIKYKQVEFMSSKIGQEFEGIISGINQKGFFVEITQNKCEGFVPMDSLENDIFVFDEDNFMLRGVNKGQKYMLGQKVIIEVIEAKLATKNLTFNIKEITKCKV